LSARRAELSLAENLQAKRKVVRACSCRLSGSDPVAAVAPDLPRGTAGGSKKADGPCRAIEIVVVMRLTTSSARPESNFQSRDRSRLFFEIVDQKRVIARNLNQGRVREYR
jgi:hypothetical protein